MDEENDPVPLAQSLLGNSAYKNASEFSFFRDYSNIFGYSVAFSYSFHYAEALLMNILYFELGGYKNIESAHIDLSDITTLMALNAKGMSNLLRGVLAAL